MNLKLVLLGKHSPALREKLEKIGSDDRLVSMDRFADEVEFDDLFAAADTIAVCYPRHCGSASILIRAAAYGSSIIGSDWGWIGWAIKNFKLGHSCDALDPQSVCNAIRAVATSEHQLGPLAERFVDYHSPTNHLAHWTELYLQRHGKLVTAEKIMLPSAQSVNASK